MKRKISLLLFVSLFFIYQIAAQSITSSSEKKSASEQKLTVDERVSVMTKKLNLTPAEQQQGRDVMKSTQQKKEELKTSNFSKKAKKAKIDALKDSQKTKLKKILGKTRYDKYKKLKSKDVL